MTRTYLMLAALGLATTACGGGGEADKAADTAESGVGQEGSTAMGDAPVETPDLLPATAAGPDGVVPGGAIDVLRREGWRVAGQPAPAAPATGATPG